MLTSQPPLGGSAVLALKGHEAATYTSTWTAPKTIKVRSPLLKISLMARVMMSSSLFIVNAFLEGTCACDNLL